MDDATWTCILELFQRGREAPPPKTAGSYPQSRLSEDGMSR